MNLLETIFGKYVATCSIKIMICLLQLIMAHKETLTSSDLINDVASCHAIRINKQMKKWKNCPCIS